jgi:phage terminase small subunit
VPASATPTPTPRPLLPRQELFAYHVANGASLAQASRLAGYSPQGARQRGSVLMTNSDIRLRVEEFRRSWMAERDATIAEAVEETGQVIETALRLNRPTAALKAIELKLKLRGVIHDRRFSLYTDSPDDDLSTCLFDPREDEDPPLEPLAEPVAEAPASPAEPPPVVPPEPALPIAAPPPQQPQVSAAKARITPAISAPAISAPTRPAPVLRIPPVPPRLLEAFNIDRKDFPTVCSAGPEESGSS